MGCENMLPSDCTERAPSQAQGPSHPLKEGRIHMVQRVGERTVSTPISLKIYGSPYGMYAVVAQDTLICKECGFISLKNCVFKRNQSKSKQPGRKEYGFEIIQTKLDLTPVTFLVSNKSELDDWESVIGSRMCTENSALREQYRAPLAPLGETPRRRTHSEPPLLPALEEEGSEE